jgi:hypothetical protein
LIQFFISFVVGSFIIGSFVGTYVTENSAESKSDAPGSGSIDVLFYAMVISLEAILSLFLCYVFFFSRRWEIPAPPCEMPPEQHGQNKPAMDKPDPAAS